MGKLARLIWVPVALMLGACDVQVHDTTPAEMTANHDIGMYPVSATVTRDSMVTAGSVYLFAVGDHQRFNMSASADGSQWQGLYEVRCKSSFPLQFLAEWRMTFGVKQKLVPPQPRMIKLNEPPLKPSASFSSSGKEPKGGWQGSVTVRFQTQPTVRLTDAHIEPTSTDRADEAAAKPISVVTKFPVVVNCGENGEVQLASKEPHAHGVLVIDTDHPALPHIRTKVEFAPQ
jgi:hypothetical protein